MEKLHHLKILFPLLIVLLPLQFFSLLPLSSAYTLPKEYFINCGSKSNFTGSGNRNFVGDLNSGVSFLVGRQSSPVPDANPSSAGVSPLYQSARIYRQPSFYEFVINENGTYFVRLHFFVSSSTDSNLANAIFNVSASGFWLLSNFTVKNSTSLPVIKEFLVTINVGRFRINFIPSEESHLAFVNAIEVFLVPENFIPDAAPRVTPAGSRNSFDGLLSQVLHTLYRINVGGLTLTPENDTLWRNWIPDDSFLFNPKTARNSTFFTDSPKYQQLGTEYIAPSLVYKTAKELNIDDSRQSNFFNITWSFNVSKSSIHFVRVHFCDIISLSLDAILFNLYIYNNFHQRISPYEKMDQLAAPFYFDFVVDSDESGIMNISIGPRYNSQNQTAFLNGLEIMELTKKSDFVLLPEKPKSKRTSLFAIVGSIGGGAFVIILIVIVFLSLKCRKAKPEQFSSWPFSVPFYERGSSYDRMSEKTANMSPSSLNLALRISYYEIVQSTKNFDSKLLIGEGGFGKVYEGMFRGKKVAMKRSEPGHGQGLLEFQTEIVVLSQIRHRHLVSLIGYCDERSEMILVYEFMEKGTLRDHLYYSTTNLEKPYSARSELSWKQRLEICIGAAKGLNYLHTGSAGGIIHRDVKSTNILLDEQFVAKVADFGLSKSSLPDVVEHSVDVKGTFGYLDPEYFISLQLTDKSDVYSFGVVLLEVLCSRPAVVTSNRREEVNLAEWGMLWLRKGKLEEIIDPMLMDTINPNSLRKFAETTEKCLKPSGSERPIMRDVLWDLEYALQLQLTPMNRGPLEDSITNASLEFSMPVVHRLPSNSFPAIDEENATVVFDDASDVTASEVFSKLRIGDAR